MNIALKDITQTGTPAVRDFMLLPYLHKGETRLLLRLNPELFEQNGAARRNAIVSLLKGLDEGEAFVVALTKNSLAVQAKALLDEVGFAADRCELCPVDDTLFSGFESWPRDILLWATASSSGKLAVVKTKSSSYLANWVVQKFGTECVDRKDVHLDGGDSLVVDGTRWIVGDGSLGWMMGSAQSAAAWRKILRFIEARMGMKPIAVGIAPGHLSLGARWTLSKMRTSYAGRLKLGPAAAMAPTLRQRVTDRVMAFFDFASTWWKEDLNLWPWAHIDIAVTVTGKQTRDGKPIVLVADTTAEGCTRNRDAIGMEEILGQIARKLSRAGFEVVRNPAPYDFRNIVLPYNNAIVQVEPAIVWLPTFEADGAATRTIDDRNIGIWKDLGFRVIPISGWLTYAMLDGCIRCATLPVPPVPAPAAQSRE